MHHVRDSDPVSVNQTRPNLLAGNDQHLQSQYASLGNTFRRKNASKLQCEEPASCSVSEEVINNGDSLRQGQSLSTHCFPKSRLVGEGDQSDVTHGSRVFSTNAYPYRFPHQSLSSSDNQISDMGIGISYDSTYEEKCSAVNNSDNRHTLEFPDREEACNSQEKRVCTPSSAFNSANDSQSKRKRKVKRSRSALVSRDSILFPNLPVIDLCESDTFSDIPFNQDGLHRPRAYISTEITSQEQAKTCTNIDLSINAGKNVSAPVQLLQNGKPSNTSIRSPEVSISSKCMTHQNPQPVQTPCSSRLNDYFSKEKENHATTKLLSKSLLPDSTQDRHCLATGKKISNRCTDICSSPNKTLGKSDDRHFITDAPGSSSCDRTTNYSQNYGKSAENSSVKSSKTESNVYMRKKSHYSVLQKGDTNVKKASSHNCISSGSPLASEYERIPPQNALSRPVSKHLPSSLNSGSKRSKQAPENVCSFSEGNKFKGRAEEVKCSSQAKKSSPTLKKVAENGKTLQSLNETPCHMVYSNQSTELSDYQSCISVKGKGHYPALERRDANVSNALIMRPDFTSKNERSLNNTPQNALNRIGSTQLSSFNSGSGDGERLMLAPGESELGKKSSMSNDNGLQIWNKNVVNGKPLRSLLKTPSSIVCSEQPSVRSVSHSNINAKDRDHYSVLHQGHANISKNLSSNCVNRPSLMSEYEQKLNISPHLNQLGTKQQSTSLINGSGDGEKLKPRKRRVRFLDEPDLEICAKRMKFSNQMGNTVPVCKNMVEDTEPLPENQQPDLLPIPSHETSATHLEVSNSRIRSGVVKGSVKRLDKKPKKMSPKEPGQFKTNKFADKQDQHFSPECVKKNDDTVKGAKKNRIPKIPAKKREKDSIAKSSQGVSKKKPKEIQEFRGTNQSVPKKRPKEIPKESSQENPQHTIYYVGGIALKMPILKLHKLDERTIEKYTKVRQKETCVVEPQMNNGSRRRKIARPKKRDVSQQYKNCNATSMVQNVPIIENNQRNYCGYKVDNNAEKEGENKNCVERTPEEGLNKNVSQDLRKMMFRVARKGNLDEKQSSFKIDGSPNDVKEKPQSELADKNYPEGKVLEGANEPSEGANGPDLKLHENTNGTNDTKPTDSSKASEGSNKMVGARRVGNPRRGLKRCDVCWQHVENVVEHIIKSHAEIFM